MEAPRLPSFFKQNRAKAFDFKPRYYDESKERIEKLRAQYAAEKEFERKHNVNPRELEEQLRKEWRSKRNTSVRSSNRTLYLVIIGLLTLTYFLIFN